MACKMEAVSEDRPNKQETFLYAYYVHWVSLFGGLLHSYCRGLLKTQHELCMLPCQNSHSVGYMWSAQFLVAMRNRKL